MKQFLRKIQNRLTVGAQRATRRLAVLAKILRLDLRNRSSRASLLDPRGPVVSLTTYGHRAKGVYLVIESIGKGSCLPSRLILWVDEPNLFHQPPATLRRLQARGLEILLCDNLGPHKKYYPFVETQDSFPLPLVTADDDILYPQYWLEGLVKAIRDHPDSINCYRARVLSLRNQQIAPYRDWAWCTSTTPSPRNLANGCSGVIYPPKILYALKKAGTSFFDCCPMADDLWLHVQEIRAGFKIRQITSTPLHFLMLPGTQTNALHRQNVEQDGNDTQIHASYTSADIALLAQSDPSA